MPLALGSLLAVALIASVASDQRYSDTLRPGFDALTAETATSVARTAQPVSTMPAVNRISSEPCDVGTATSTLRTKVLKVPEKLGGWAIAVLSSHHSVNLSI